MQVGVNLYGETNSESQICSLPASQLRAPARLLQGQRLPDSGGLLLASLELRPEHLYSPAFAEQPCVLVPVLTALKRAPTFTTSLGWGRPGRILALEHACTRSMTRGKFRSPQK